MIKILIFCALFLAGCSFSTPHKISLQTIQHCNFGSNRIYLVGFFDSKDTTEAKKVPCQLDSELTSILLQGTLLPGGQMYLLEDSSAFLKLLNENPRLKVRIGQFEGLLISKQENKKNLIFKILPNTIIFDL